MLASQMRRESALHRPASMVLATWSSFQVNFMTTACAGLAERVDHAISTNPYLAGRKLRFETAGSRVVLQGTVGSFFQKQMAQEVLRRVDGVEQIENHLEVEWAKV